MNSQNEPTRLRPNRLAYLNEKREQMINSCTACGKCLRECRIFKRGMYRNEKSRTVMLSVLEWLKNDNFSKIAEYTAQTCTSCGECTSKCPEKLVPLLLFRSAVDKLKKEGRSEESELDFAYLLGNLQIEESDIRYIREYKRFPGKPVDIVLFPGCDSIRAPQEILTYRDILNKLELNYLIIWNEDLCCGYKGYAVNDFDEGDRLAKNLIAKIDDSGAKKLLLPCAQCYNQFTKTLSKSFNYSFEVLYFPQFIIQNLDSLNFPQPVSRTVTIHDSCKVSRGLKEFEHVRSLLSNISGLKMLEMESNKNLSICCGGTKNFSHPELTAWLIKERFEQAKRIGADVLVTDCTLCYSIYSILKDQYSIDVRHYSSLVAEAMGIEKRTDRYQELFHKSKEEILSEIKQKKVFIGKMNIDDINSQIDLFIFFANKLKEVAY